ncbi:Fanconi anemia group E protein isoform X2 [Dendropsophus ebraccatus]|uniref:Fanconi anemia group E protein isoform X2 n=1 Tax=Dendropsophus ebraccatus TaxID=150705 RepID=UPI0038310D9C
MSHCVHGAFLPPSPTHGHAAQYTHFILGSAPEAHARRPLLIPVPVIRPGLAVLQLHHPTPPPSLPSSAPAAATLACPGGVYVKSVDCAQTIMANSLCDDDRAGRLFLQALGTGSHGFLAAYRVLEIFPGPFPWNSLLENLCMKVPSQDGSTGKLILKPKLLQLPIQLQRNLLSILIFVFHLLPPACVQLLAETLRTESYVSDEWLLYYTQQFLKNGDHESCEQRAQVTERLQIICTGLNKTGGKLSTLCRYKARSDSPQTDCPMQCESEPPLEEERGSTLNVHTEELSRTSQSCISMEAEEGAAPKETEEVPAVIKGHMLNLKQMIYLEMDSETLDTEYVLGLKTVCDLCNPLQLRIVFSSVGIKQISPKCLFRLCSHLDSISPDLSYAHAESLASILFLEQALLLTAPASRTLTAALTVFCKKYAWPACNTLISPLLAKAETALSSRCHALKCLSVFCTCWLIERRN